MTPKVISLSVLEYNNIFKKFTSFQHFQDISGLQFIGERVLWRNNKKKFLLLFKVLDSKKLLYAKIKYEF